MTAEDPRVAEPGRRIVTLDVIRGIAVMGIFSANVVGMAMIEPAYVYPPAFGLESAWDAGMWAANFVLVDGKMRSLFTMLFGASMLLLIDRAEVGGHSATGVHFPRMLVLLLIGLIHFYAIWWGDILTTYALVGMIAFAFRRIAAEGLLVLSLLLFAAAALPSVGQVPERFEVYEAAHSPSADPAARQQWLHWSQWYFPSRADLAAYEEAHHDPLSHVRVSGEERLAQPLETLASDLFETLALMLLGMAAYKSGFLGGGWSERAYRRTAVAGIAIGAAGFMVLAAWVLASGFRWPETTSAFFSLSAPFRPVMALGYAAAIILLFRQPSGLRSRLAAVGRTAFTNYLGASLVGMLVFFDFGLGLYGELSRAECWLLVPLVWIAMLLWSKPWLDRFHHGPLEWLWRSLARGQFQPMRRSGGPSATAV